MHPLRQELVDKMNLIHEPPANKKITAALLNLPSLIEGNLISFVTMSADGEMILIFSFLTLPQNSSPIYKSVFSKCPITRYDLKMPYQDPQVLNIASIYGNSAGKLTGV
jgi:hypothetical protein